MLQFRVQPVAFCIAQRNLHCSVFALRPFAKLTSARHVLHLLLQSAAILGNSITFFLSLFCSSLLDSPGESRPPSRQGFEIRLRHDTQHSQHAPAGFEPSIPASERPQTHALNRAALGIGHLEPYTKWKLRRSN